MRPVEDGIKLLKGEEIQGTKLSEAKIINEKIVSIYECAKFEFKKKWFRPRIKVLARKNSAC